MSLAVFLALLGAIWWLILPPQLGGRTTLFTTAGVSMEPHLHTGDLAILRKHSSYKVGDVVAFHSRTLNATVLHRVIAVENGTLTTQGDNNTWTDTDRPKKSQVIGRLDAHYEGLGVITQWLAMLPVRILGALLVGISVFFGIHRTRRVNESKNDDEGADTSRDDSEPSYEEQPNIKHGWSKRSIASGVVAVLCIFTSLLFGIPALRTPVRAPSGDIIYNHKGRFDYSAVAAKGGETVYGSDHASTGDILYLNLVNDVYVTYRYTLEGLGKPQYGGKLSMWMDVRGSSGWKRTFPLAENRPVGPGGGAADAVIKVKDILSLVNQVNTLTGVRDANYFVTIRVETSFEGKFAGAALKEDFSSNLSFDGTDRLMRIAAAPKEADTEKKKPSEAPTGPRDVQTITSGIDTGKGGTLYIERGELRNLSFFGIDFPVLFARVFSITLFVIGITLLIYSRHFGRGRLWPTMSRQSFIEVPRLLFEDQSREFSRLSELVDHAKKTDQLVLHAFDGKMHTYGYNVDHVTYWHQSSVPEASQRFGADEETNIPVTPSGESEDDAS